MVSCILSILLSFRYAVPEMPNTRRRRSNEVDNGLAMVCFIHVYVLLFLHLPPLESY